MRAFRDSVKRQLPRLVFLFCLSQPILDVLGYWQQYFALSNVLTLALRMLLLGGSVGLGFLLSERKRFYFLTFGVLGLFTALHALACLLEPGGYEAPVKDLVNLVRIYFLPLTFLCFATFLRQNDKVYDAMKKGLLADLILIAAVQLISALTGTDPHTYHHDQIGILGWFLWTNSQSAILSMLMPIAICWALRRWEDKALPVGIIALASGLPLYLLAPRLAYACLLACCFGLGLWTLFGARKRWKQALAILVAACIFVTAYPLSSTKARRAVVYTETENHQKWVEGKQITELKRPQKNQPLTDEEAAAYEPIYHSLSTVYSVVERFGLRRTLEAYDYTLDASVLGDARLRKRTYCNLLMEDSGPMTRVFGLNLSRMFQFIPQGFYNEKTQRWEDGYESLDVENDFSGIYFLTGWAGLALMLAFLLWFGLRALRSLKGLWGTVQFLELGAFCAAYCCAILHGYFTASVLRRNNASVYMALILAGIWYLTQRDQRALSSENTTKRA